MQSAQIVSALGLLRKRLFSPSSPFDADQIDSRLEIIQALREEARWGDRVRFSNYVRARMAGPEGDTMVDILEELWAELGIPSTGTWEDFSEKFL